MAKDETQEHRDARFLEEIQSLREEIAAEQAGTAASSEESGAPLHDAPTSTADEAAPVEQQNEKQSETEEGEPIDAETEGGNADKTLASKKCRDSYKDADFRSTLRELRSFTSDESEDEYVNRKVTLSTILGGDILAGPWFRRQFVYIIMVLFMVIVYINNRYTCQQKMIEQRALNDTLLDRRYKALTRSSQLKERMRRNYIEEALTDTTLQTANTPSFNLKVDQE